MADLGHAAYGRSGVWAEAAGHRYLFPYAPAGTWLDRMTDPHHFAVRVIHLMDPDFHELFLDRIEENTHARRDILQLARAAIAAASGRKWWEAERLAHLACADTVIGSVMATGADPERMSLAAYLSLVWVTVAKNLDENKRMAVEMELTLPPPEAVEQNDVPEMDLSSTVAMLRNLPGVRTG